MAFIIKWATEYAQNIIKDKEENEMSGNWENFNMKYHEDKSRFKAYTDCLNTIEDIEQYRQMFVTNSDDTTAFDDESKIDKYLG